MNQIPVLSQPILYSSSPAKQVRILIYRLWMPCMDTEIKPGSPCIDAGINIENNGGADLLKTAIVPGCTDIGAMAYSHTAKKAWHILLERVKNPVFTFIPNNPALPNVLIYGDSISIGYTQPVRKNLEDEANVYRIYCNGGDSGSFIEKMTKMHDALRDKRNEGHWSFEWDVIHFNVGLHDLKYWYDGKLDLQKGKQVNSTDEYAQHLRRIISYLKRLAPRATHIFATTNTCTGGIVRTSCR